MNLEIKDQDLRDILKATIKEEVRLLAIHVLARPKIRDAMWKFTRQQFTAALLVEAGLSEEAAGSIETSVIEANTPPSGPAGGVNFGGDDTKGGGGGGVNSPGDDTQGGGGGGK